MQKATSRKFYGKQLATAIYAVLIIGACPAFGASVGSTGAGHGVSGGAAVGASMPKSERVIREQLLVLGELDSPDTAAAVEFLKKAPRAELLAVLRDDLRANPVSVPVATLKALALVQARELAPELKAVAAKSDDWTVFAHINALVADDRQLRSEFAKIYLERLPSLLASPAKVAVLDGLTGFKIAVGDAEFGNLLVASNYDVRISAVRNLLETIGSLAKTERVRRLVLALDVRPKQARVLALKTVSRLPASERKSFAGLLTRARCEREADKRLRSACQSALKSLGPGGGDR